MADRVMVDRRSSHCLVQWILDQVPPHELHRILVVAPSAAAAALLRRAATEARGAICGVHFVTPRGLAEDLLLLGGRPWRRPALDPLQERERLRTCLSQDSVGQYAARFEGGLLRLLASVKELERHGPPGAGAAPTPWGEQVLRVAAQYQERTRGFDTRGNRMAAALELVVDGCAALPESVLVVGFARVDNDLQKLLDALSDRGTEVRAAPAAEHRPADVKLHGCPGFAEELRVAARLCMQAAERDIMWHEMVVAAPTLTPYQPQLRRAFDAEGVPFRTALESPLIRYPRPSLLLHLARLLFHDAPRQSWVALATSPLLVEFVPAEQQALFDRRSREQHLEGPGEHVLEFASDLRKRLQQDSPLPELIQAVHQVRQQAGDMDMASWTRQLQSFAGTWLRQPSEDEAEVSDRLQECLAALANAGAGEVGSERYLRELEDILHTRGIELPGQTRGGVQVVTYENALAFPCRHLHLLGLAEGMVPGPPPSETFLGDEDRRELGLRNAEGERHHQEQLLVCLLGPAGELALSYPRKNALGMPVSHTSWLDRIEATLGSTVRSIEPSHPEARARQRLDEGSCPRDLALEHLLLTRGRKALQPTHPELLRDLSLRQATLLLSWARDLDQFGASSLRRDGDVGVQWGFDLSEQAISVSALDTLGRCPQRYLFEKGMGIRPLPEEQDVTAMAANTLGSVIHSCLERLYGEFQERINQAEKPRELADEMVHRAGEILDEEMAAAGGPMQRELPALHRLLRGCWQNGVARLLRDDLGRLSGDGGRIEGLEYDLEEELLFPAPHQASPTTMRVKGRLDRLDTLPDGSYRVIDFKTSRKPDNHVNANNILQGQYPQLPIYAMLVQAAKNQRVTEIEIGAVVPFVTGNTPESKVKHALPSTLAKPDSARGLLETYAVMAELRERGVLPPQKGEHCGFCKFQLACRRYHPPSVERVANADIPQLRRFKRLGFKRTKAPLLYPEEPR